MEIRTQVQAYKLLALHTKGKETINVMDILHHNYCLITKETIVRK